MRFSILAILTVAMLGCGSNDDLQSAGDRAAEQRAISAAKVVNQVSDPFSTLDYNDEDADEARWTFPTTFFYTNQHHIRFDQVEALNDMAARIRERPSLLLELTGYADERGSRISNMILAHKRALAVRDYLVREGVDAQQLIVLSQGEIPGSRPEQMAANRKTEPTLVRE